MNILYKTFNKVIFNRFKKKLQKSKKIYVEKSDKNKHLNNSKLFWSKYNRGLYFDTFDALKDLSILDLLDKQDYNLTILFSYFSHLHTGDEIKDLSDFWRITVNSSEIKEILIKIYSECLDENSTLLPSKLLKDISIIKKTFRKHYVLIYNRILEGG